MEILGHAFFECTDLTSITISSNVSRIPKHFCNGCTSLTSIVIPSNVIHIETSAFGASGLTSVSIPDSVESIGTYAFWNSKNLDSVTVGKDVPKMGESAFGTEPPNEKRRCHKCCSPGPNACHKVDINKHIDHELDYLQGSFRLLTCVCIHNYTIQSLDTLNLQQT